jgi:hypothetical protein
VIHNEPDEIAKVAKGSPALRTRSRPGERIKADRRDPQEPAICTAHET